MRETQMRKVSRKVISGAVRNSARKCRTCVHVKRGSRTLAHDPVDSVKYVVGDDDSFPTINKDSNSKRLSAASAALDLAPLSQTPPRAYGQRPFDTGLKTSDWPNFQTGPHRGMTSPLPSQATMADAQESSLVGSYKESSPTGMGDSIASLPAMPSKSVPGTPFGVVNGNGNHNNGGGMSGLRRSGTSPKLNDGLSQAQRGFSNPDLARSFGKAGGFSSINDQPRVSNAFPSIL
jgi:hypothetical protein